MTMSTRSRLSLFLAIATLVVAGILGSQGVSAGSPGTPPDGSEPAGGGFDDVAGICVEPDSASGAEPDTDCDDTIDDPVVVDPGECGGEGRRLRSGCRVVSYTPCPGDEPPVVTDPDQGAKLVEPTPGMADVRCTHLRPRLRER